MTPVRREILNAKHNPGIIAKSRIHFSGALLIIAMARAPRTPNTTDPVRYTALSDRLIVLSRPPSITIFRSHVHATTAVCSRVYLRLIYDECVCSSILPGSEMI